MSRPPYAANGTAPVRAVVLTKAERFENLRNRATHASPICLLDALTVEGRYHRFGNHQAAEQGAFDLRDTAADQFSGHGALAGFQIGDLRAELAVLVGEIAGREIVEG
jgi:hypothetical protein